MPNPRTPQGTLNRLRASFVIPSLAQLNVISGNLDKDGISISFQGESTVYIDTMTGAVTSPEPYLRCVVKIHLLKTQPLSDLYKKQMETISTIGPASLITDASTLSDYDLENCSIMGVDEIQMNGQVAGYVVNIGGIYQINNALWDQG